MIKGEVTEAVQWFTGFSMLRQGLQSFVRPGPWAACSSKNIREKPVTCWSWMSSLDDLTSAWKYQVPVPCRVEKIPNFCCSHQTSPKTCTFVRKTMGLQRWVGKSDLQPWSNLRMLWVLEEQNQPDVTCCDSKRDDKKRSYHGRSTVFRVFNAASRASILCQTRAAGSFFFQKHQRESDECWSFWFLHGSIRFQFPAVLERYHSNDQTLTKTCMFVGKTMGLPRWGYNSKRTTKGYQSALKDKDVSWPHAHSLESRCGLASMRQVEMPQFQEAISWVRLV